MAVIIFVTYVGCKKKPDEIRVVLFDPLLDQPVSNAEVSLVEMKLQGGVSSGGGNCDVINRGNTDANGVAIIKGAELKKNSKYNYFATVSNFSGHPIQFSCANHPREGYLEKSGKTFTTKIYYYFFESTWDLQLINLAAGFGDSANDSLSIYVYRDYPQIEDFDSDLNGDKSLDVDFVLNKNILAQFPTKTDFFLERKCRSGKYRIVTYKRKNNVVTLETNFLKIMPFERRKISLMW